MTKVTKEMYVPIPKDLAEQLEIRPGTEVRWRQAGDGLRLDPQPVDDQSEARRRVAREALVRSMEELRIEVGERGWTRGELYDRHDR